MAIANEQGEQAPPPKDFFKRLTSGRWLSPKSFLLILLVFFTITFFVPEIACLFSKNCYQAIGQEKNAAVANTGATCGTKSKMQRAPNLTICDKGITTTEKSSNGFYRKTSFGCSGPTSTWDSPSSDNCIPACGLSLKSVTKTTGTVKLPSHNSYRGEYESKVEYFAANRDQYGCGSHLKITNPKDGRSVVVVVIDAGPHCTSAHQTTKGLTVDVSGVAGTKIGDPGYVKVEQVSKDTPIGYYPPCKTVDSGSQLLSCLISGQGTGSNSFDSILKNITNLYL